MSCCTVSIRPRAEEGEYLFPTSVLANITGACRLPQGIRLLFRSTAKAMFVMMLLPTKANVPANSSNPNSKTSSLSHIGKTSLTTSGQWSALLRRMFKPLLTKPVPPLNNLLLERSKLHNRSMSRMLRGRRHTSDTHRVSRTEGTMVRSSRGLLRCRRLWKIQWSHRGSSIRKFPGDHLVHPLLYCGVHRGRRRRQSRRSG